jgi:hypothetical protein
MKKLLLAGLAFSALINPAMARRHAAQGMHTIEAWRVAADQGRTDVQ